MTLALRLAALLECLAAAERHGGDENAMRFAEGASLLAAAARPQLRVGTLATVTLAQSLRTVALTLEPQTRSAKGRLLAEAAMSAGLGWLLHRSACLARWDG